MTERLIASINHTFHFGKRSAQFGRLCVFVDTKCGVFPPKQNVTQSVSGRWRRMVFYDDRVLFYFSIALKRTKTDQREEVLLSFWPLSTLFPLFIVKS